MYSGFSKWFSTFQCPFLPLPNHLTLLLLTFFPFSPLASLTFILSCPFVSFLSPLNSPSSNPPSSLFYNWITHHAWIVLIRAQQNETLNASLSLYLLTSSAQCSLLSFSLTYHSFFLLILVVVLLSRLPVWGVIVHVSESMSTRC